jgi:hypothetical protein
MTYLNLYRELALQIYDVFSTLVNSYQTWRCMLFVGGTSIQEDIENFTTNGAQVCFTINYMISNKQLIICLITC